VRDIFGDYGLVGVLLFEAIEGSLRVDTFLLSCRALGRGVEDRMVEDLKRWAIERGVERVAIPFSPTARNKPALEFLSRLCDVPAEPTGSFECVLAADGSTTEWRPSAKVEPVVEPETVSAKLASDEGELLAVIAKELQSAHAIIEAANASDKKLRARHNEEFAAPGTLLEESLARIWSDILGVEPIGATDNFFELGGQSLSAVLMLAKVRSATDIELDLTEVFEHPSLRELAERIERRRSQPQEAAGSHLRVG
jgi:acyl carrier protein